MSGPRDADIAVRITMFLLLLDKVVVHTLTIVFFLSLVQFPFLYILFLHSSQSDFFTIRLRQVFQGLTWSSFHYLNQGFGAGAIWLRPFLSEPEPKLAKGRSEARARMNESQLELEQANHNPDLNPEIPGLVS